MWCWYTLAIQHLGDESTRKASLAINFKVNLGYVSLNKRKEGKEKQGEKKKKKSTEILSHRRMAITKLSTNVSKSPPLIPAPLIHSPRYDMTLTVLNYNHLHKTSLGPLQS